MTRRGLGDHLASILGKAVGLRVRREAFGAIAMTERPAALFYLDEAGAKAMGCSEPAPEPAGSAEHRAPVEVHWTLSRRCDQACTACYTQSVPNAAPFNRERLEATVEALASAGVFHVAIGGGEPLADPFILEVARALRARGLSPSTTTSGGPVTPDLARRLTDFAQVNVSIDAPGAAYAEVRGHDRFAMADAALRLLQRHVPRVGINAVLTRSSFAHLDELVRYAKERRVTELELLRLKPAGRGRANYLEQRLTPEQAESVLPRVLALAKRYRVRIKFDCSFAPFVYHHAPEPRVLAFFRIHGCEAGDSLASINPEGGLTGCSFLAAEAGPATVALGKAWAGSPVLERLRRYRQEPPEPCKGCAYLKACNGGCRAVSAHLTGDPYAPDPECPRVRRAADPARDPARDPE